MDQKDRRILRILQKDATLSMNELAERSALSKTAVWRRVKALEDKGVIRKCVTLLDKETLGFGLTIFALVRTNQHSDEIYQQLIRKVDFADVSSTFVMETFKSETELPI